MSGLACIIKNTVRVCVCARPCTDPDGGLVRPDGLLLAEPEEETLLEGIPRVIEGE